MEGFIEWLVVQFINGIIKSVSESCAEWFCRGVALSGWMDGLMDGGRGGEGGGKF